MQPHIHSKVNSGLLQTLNEVRRYVDDIPDNIIGPDGQIKLTCHHVATAVACHVPTLKVVHGYFDSACEHAWLETTDQDWIIDPYPPLMLGGPVLVYMSSAQFSPWRRIYDAERKPALNIPHFREEVAAILEAVERKRMFLFMP